MLDPYADIKRDYIALVRRFYDELKNNYNAICKKRCIDSETHLKWSVWSGGFNRIIRDTLSEDETGFFKKAEPSLKDISYLWSCRNRVISEKTKNPLLQKNKVILAANKDYNRYFNERLRGHI